MRGLRNDPDGRSPPQGALVKVLIRYAAESDIFLEATGRPTVESLEADDLGDGRAELRQHATFIPLAPGDVVAYDVTETATAVLKLVPVYTYEVSMKLPNDPERTDHAAELVKGIFEEWRRDAWVTQDTRFSALVSSQTQRWFDETVRPNRYVNFIDERRTPELRLDLDVAVQHPDLNGAGGGPWA